MTVRRHLVVFLKAPRLGQAKRRLAAGIGFPAANTFYRRVSGRIIHRLGRQPQWRLWLAVTPDRFARRARFWPAGPTRRPQGPGDLGARMARAIETLPPGPVVIIGSDIPDIRPAHIARAFAALGAADVVFGPSGDGGYWLVGTRRRRLARRMFKGVRWSTEYTLSDTLAHLDGRTRVAYVDQLDDVDDRDAFECWRQRSRISGRSG